MKRTLFRAMFFQLIVFATVCQADDVGPIYAVDLSDAINHYATVTMTAESSGSETLLMMPTWTPGSYMIREYARNIDRIKAEDLRGKELKIEKISKNRWRIDTGSAKKFKVTYRTYCNEQSVRTNWVGVSYGVLTGAATFVTIPDQRDRPHRVSLKLPNGWRRSATSLRPDGKELHHYRAESYDELVDSPIVAGKMEIFPFIVAGVEHYLVDVNPTSDVDGEKAANDLSKIIAEVHKVWGVVPYERYYFINVNAAGGGGLEHDNCCLLMSTQLDAKNRDSYKGWLGLASHEFFHAWNIRRLRPKPLVHYDYENEVYTSSLWIAEGITTYYQDLLVARAGLITQSDLIRHVSSQISSLQRTDGRTVQSLGDSSYDAWIKFYRPSENARETQISYYTKGAVVGLLLDVEIRRASAGEKCLDDALKIMFERFANGVGYTPEDFRAVCSEVAGADLTDWFDRAVDSTDELDYQGLADWFGLNVGEIRPTGLDQDENADKDAASDGDQDDSDNGAEALSNARTRPGARRLGAGRARPSSFDDSKPRRWLGIGEPNSPATNVGLADTDEILAVNDERLTDDIEARVQDFKVGDPLKILISRDGEIREILVAVGELPARPSWTVRTASGATKEQKQHLKMWISGERAAPAKKSDADEATPDDKPSAENSVPADDSEKSDGNDGGE